MRNRDMRDMWKTPLALCVCFGILGKMPEVLALSAQTIPNPIADSDFKQLVVTITGQLTPLALIIATVAIIVVGFQMVYAASIGKPEEAAKLKTTLFWVLIGAAVIVGAQFLAQVVVNTIQKL